MLRSMTGFGHEEQTAEGITLTVEMRSVNHRYSDVYLRMPKGFHLFEDMVRKIIAGHVTRGKVDVFVTVDRRTDTAQEVVLDEALADSYHQALRRLSERYAIADGITAATLSRFPDVLQVVQRDDSERIGELLRQTVEACVRELVTMRGREGERLAESLRENLSEMGRLLAQISRRAPLVVKDFKERLETRIAELVDSQKVDPARLAMEVALFADKCSIDEELVRLESHMAQFGEMLQAGSPIGKKIDFLIQEMNREVNTIGSKSNNLEITQLVVSLKSEVEKMREQIQNIE